MAKFIFDNRLKEIGINGYYTIAKSSSILSDSRKSDIKTELEKGKRELINHLGKENYPNDTILDGYKLLHSRVGVSNRKNVSSPEMLWKRFAKTNSLPSINLLVDYYNLISLKHSIAIGIHDLKNVRLPISLTLTTGNEKFVPIGNNNEPKDVRPEIYSYIDSDNEILCYLETKQVEKSKVDSSSQEIFIIVQGNPNVNQNLLEKCNDELISGLETLFSYSILEQFTL